jgi:hypothetical protein
MTSRAHVLRAAGTAALLVVVVSGCGTEEPEPKPIVRNVSGGGPNVVPPSKEERLGPYPRSQFYIQRDLFEAADEPATVPAADVTFLRDDDEVLGFVIRAKARAYAVTMLSWHHVVNDVVAGIPVAVTY